MGGGSSIGGGSLVNGVGGTTHGATLTAAFGGNTNGSTTLPGTAAGGTSVTGTTTNTTATGGATTGHTSTGGAATGGASTGGAATGGAATGGASTGGKSGGGTGGTSSATGGTVSSTFVEDDGTECTIGTLPEVGSLTAITKLPDPFKKLDGTRLAKKAEWRCRREEIKKLAEKFALGSKAVPKTVTGTVSSSKITVDVSDNGKKTSFSATVSLPTTGTAPYPAVIVYGGMGADTATIKAAGAAIINYDPYIAGKEGTPRTAKAGAYYDIAGSSSTTGLLVAWAWGVSRIIDVIAASDGKVLRADGIGVTGCSRFGKGSFIAGVLDQRVALTMPIESGSAGVPIWRGIPGEGAQTLSSAYGEQPWFGDAFSSFTGSPTKAPLDTHELVAMVAPRGLFIMDNPHIANLGPKSAHAAVLAGAEVYKALGAIDNVTYWSDVADGSHCSLRPEWKDPLTKNIQKFLLKTGTYTGVIKASSKATAKATDWIDWTSPTLE
jgi:hypothetical protein